jgi:putative transposase
MLGLLPDAQSRSSHPYAHHAEGLSKAVGEAHRRYTAFFNARARVTGHLFQARFASTAMDEAHCLAAMRYLAFSPVRAKLVQQPADWAWSSAGAHLRRRSDALVTVKPLLALAPDPKELLTLSRDEASDIFDFETKSAAGRPLGDDTFIAAVEKKLGYSVSPQKRGPKARSE